MSEPLRLVVVGDSGVGKTSLLLSWTTRCFTESYEPTVFENSRAHITLDGTPHELLLVDTTGSEEWDSLYPLAWLNADCFLLCFSLVDRTSLENSIHKWAAEIRKNAGPAGGFIVLVGTKSDMRTPATADPVTTSQGHVAATSSKIPVYLECSSKTQRVFTHACSYFVLFFL
eukprot:gnl/Spiro4/12048_TR6355_c0_g1_i2.p1 gnl/Spiro4/12048_TR6355_c0_g1~~gnl/Spiro4/12048_TR6355_c0_g1_i2.p1  ORF type:complete len:172 (-),score=28.03 gnl/Spiro4/12048_TR6355_c0_g1_i2:17-532(-)